MPETIITIEDGIIRLPPGVAPAKGSHEAVIQVSDDGIITLTPIDPEQRWFWTPEWQRGEREADEDAREGRYERYHSGAEFLDSFD